MALTVIHSSSLTNRIRAKRKKISGSSSKVPSAHLRGSGLQTAHTLGSLLSSLFLFLLPWELVDGWAGSCWWAENVEIRSSESRVDLSGRWFSFWEMVGKCGKLVLWVLGAMLLSCCLYMETGLYVDVINSYFFPFIDKMLWMIVLLYKVKAQCHQQNITVKVMTDVSHTLILLIKIF